MAGAGATGGQGEQVGQQGMGGKKGHGDGVRESERGNVEWKQRCER